MLTLKLTTFPLSDVMTQRRDLPFPEYSSVAIQKLEDDVVEEMVARRKSMANRNSTAKALGFFSRYFGI